MRVFGGTGEPAQARPIFSSIQWEETRIDNAFQKGRDSTSPSAQFKVFKATSSDWF